MTLQRIFIAVSIILFGTIGALALYKKQKSASTSQQMVVQKDAKKEVKSFEGEPVEIDWKKLQNSKPQTVKSKEIQADEKESYTAKPQNIEQNVQQVATLESGIKRPEDMLADVDHIDLLFKKGSDLPIVETVKYKSRVSWKAGKSAWLIDYASHYNTPIDFIARSINGTRDYSIKTIIDGQEFNVLKPEKDFSFHLVIDLSRCKLWLYYNDPEEHENFLLKTYRVGLGRIEAQTKSGSLTPLGTYKLGSRTAVFKPKMMGFHKNKRVELIRVFGTRWIPFEREVANCTEPAKGFGIHGTPWSYDEQTEQVRENNTSIGHYESDGCIRLATKDIEELFAVISTRDTTVEIVKNFELKSVNQ
jgi:hypothetical protein